MRDEQREIVPRSRTVGFRIPAELDRLAALEVAALPVCAGDGAVPGMLADLDLIVKALARQLDLLRVPVCELLDGPPVLIGPDDELHRVAGVMSGHRLRRVPVVYRGRPVGIITQADVARAPAHVDTGAPPGCVLADH